MTTRTPHYNEAKLARLRPEQRTERSGVSAAVAVLASLSLFAAGASKEGEPALNNVQQPNIQERLEQNNLQLLQPPSQETDRVNDASPEWLPAQISRWYPTIEQVIDENNYDLDPDFVIILLAMESGGDPEAVSNKGACGLLQVMPTTAPEIAERLDRETYNLTADDGRDSIEFGINYLHWLKNTMDVTRGAGDAWPAYLASAYNGGAGAAYDRANGLSNGSENDTYATRALKLYEDRNKAASPSYERWYGAGVDLSRSYPECEQIGGVALSDSLRMRASVLDESGGLDLANPKYSSKVSL